MGSDFGGEHQGQEIGDAAITAGMQSATSLEPAHSAGLRSEFIVQEWRARVQSKELMEEITEEVHPFRVYPHDRLSIHPSFHAIQFLVLLSPACHCSTTARCEILFGDGD